MSLAHPPPVTAPMALQLAPMPVAPHTPRLRWWTASLAVGYTLAALLSLYLARQPGSVATIWYANALAVAFLAFRRPADWPWLLVATAAANTLANVIWGDSAWIALSFLPANLAEIVVGALALRWAGLTKTDLRSLRPLLLLLLLGGLLPQLLGATLGALTIVGPSMNGMAGVWLAWFEGSVIGAVSALPLAFVACRQGPGALRAALLDARLAVLLPAAAGMALLALAQLPFPFVYLSIPLLLAAVLLDQAAVMLLTLVVSIVVALALANGIFVPPPLRAAWEQVFVYLALAAALLPAQLLAAALADLRDSHARLAARTLELRQSNDGLEQFVRIASHDMREPLNTVVQFGSLLEQDEADRLSPDGRHYLSLMMRATRRMRTLLDDVLEFARLRRGEAVPLQAVSLDALMLDLQGMLAGRLREGGARLDVAPLPMVRGNVTMLSLLFQNLISNALKFMPAGRAPEVAVSARIEGRDAWITVADNGIGIDAADLPKLFQPFQRLQLRRLYEGTGLGLALAQQVAQAHGGEIVVSSVPGEGSRFSVRLPLV